MTDMIRTFTPELEIRSAAHGGDGRTIEGIAVPYGKPQQITPQLREQFALGAFAHQMNAAHRVPFTRDHMQHGGTLIGKTTSLREDPVGLIGSWRVSKTPAGDETLELVKDGALQDLSIGFRERQNRRLNDGTVERTSADLREVSVVLLGAYGDGAAVTGVRQAEEAVCPTCAVTATRAAQAAQILAGLPVLPPVAFA